MAAPYGGETPLLKYGTSLTVEAPAGTTATVPVEQGDLLKIDGTTDASGRGWKAVACAGDDDTADGAIIVMALHRITEERELGVQVLSGGVPQVRRLKYRAATGTPTKGQSVAIDNTDVRKVKGVTRADRKGLITAVFTATTEVEVLLGV